MSRKRGGMEDWTNL